MRRQPHPTPDIIQALRQHIQENHQRIHELQVETNDGKQLTAFAKGEGLRGM